MAHKRKYDDNNGQIRVALEPFSSPKCSFCCKYAIALRCLYVVRVLCARGGERWRDGGLHSYAYIMGGGGGGDEGGEPMRFCDIGLSPKAKQLASSEPAFLCSALTVFGLSRFLGTRFNAAEALGDTVGVICGL